MKRPLDDEEISILVVLAAIIALCVTMLLLTGCRVMPEHVIVRGPHGTKIAEANTKTGDIRLTQYGIHVITPKIQFPRSEK